MTKIHAQLIGDQVLLPMAEFEQLVAVARRCEEVDLQVREGEITTHDMMLLADRSGAFDFWRDEGEDIYSVDDGEPV